MSITYTKKNKKRNRKHGFLKRSETAGGQKTLSRRRAKKRWQLTV